MLSVQLLDSDSASARGNLCDPLAPGVSRHLDRCFAAARAIAESEDLARDAVQEALVLFWTAECEPPDVRGWLVRTTVHRALHHARSRTRSARHERYAAGERHELEHRGDPRLLLESRELLSEIMRAVLLIPDEYRTAFQLREIAGLDYDEIALQLQVPIGTVRSRLSRARACLRRRLAHLVQRDGACALCPSPAPARRARAF